MCNFLCQFPVFTRGIMDFSQQGKDIFSTTTALKRINDSWHPSTMAEKLGKLYLFVKTKLQIRYTPNIACCIEGILKKRGASVNPEGVSNLNIEIPYFI